MEAKEILEKHARNYFKDSPCDGEFILSKRDILPAMIEFAEIDSIKFVEWVRDSSFKFMPYTKKWKDKDSEILTYCTTQELYEIFKKTK